MKQTSRPPSNTISVEKHPGKHPRIVSVELKHTIAGWESVVGVLEEIQNCHNDTLKFLGGIFDEVGQLGNSLVQYERHLVTIENQLQNEQTDSSSPSNAAPLVDPAWREWQETSENERREIRSAQEIVEKQLARLAGIATDLAESQKAFHEQRLDLKRQCEELVHAVPRSDGIPTAENAAPLQAKIQDMQQECSTLARERAVLETELESLRHRAAELTEALSHEKKNSAVQQVHWNEELHTMRSLMEKMMEQVAEVEREVQTHTLATATAANRVQNAASNNDPALGSVLAQFEMIQQDRARRKSM